MSIGIVTGGKGLKGGSGGYAKLGFSTIDEGMNHEGMLLPSKSGFVQLTNQNQGGGRRRRRRGTKRRCTTKRSGSKRRGTTKRRGSKRRGTTKRRKTHKRKH